MFNKNKTKKTIMGLKFQENNVALFKTNIYSTFGSIIDFTMSFWIRVDFFDGSKKIILTNENYKDYEVFMVKFFYF